MKNKIDRITANILRRVGTSVIIRKRKRKHDTELTGRPTLTRKKISRKLLGRKLTAKHREGIAKAMCKAWEIRSPTGKNHLVYNLKAWCLKKGLNYNCMVGVSTGRQKQHRGFTCKRLD